MSVAEGGAGRLCMLAHVRPGSPLSPLYIHIPSSPHTHLARASTTTTTKQTHHRKPTRHRPPPRVLGITLRHLLPCAVQGEVLQGTHAALVQEAAGGREEVSGQMRGRGRSPRAPRPRLSRKLQGRVEGQQEEVSGQVRGRCRSSSAPRPRSSRKGSCRRGRGGGG